MYHYGTYQTVTIHYAAIIFNGLILYNFKNFKFFKNLA